MPQLDWNRRRRPVAMRPDGLYAYVMFPARHDNRHHHHSCFGGPVELHAN
jgi:hypothetical protein